MIKCYRMKTIIYRIYLVEILKNVDYIMMSIMMNY